MTTMGPPGNAPAGQLSNVGKLLGYVGWSVVTAFTLVSNGIMVVLGAIAFAVLGLLMLPFVGAVTVASGARRASDLADQLVDRRMWVPLSIMVASLAISAALAVMLAFVGMLILIPAVVAAGALITATVYTLSDFRISGGRDQPGWAEPVTVSSSAAEVEAPRVMAPRGDVVDVSRLWHTDIFRSLAEAQVNEIAKLGTVRHYDEGSGLGEEERLSERFYAVLGGKAQLTSNSGLGPITVRVATSGESFPLASLVGYGLLVTSATAMTPMVVWEIEVRTLLDHCNRNPEVSSRIFASAAAVLAERYRDTLTRLALAAEQAVEGVETRVTI